ncbi:MAG: hydroxyisourate hydrolase [Casimicrobiaceae bacterium]
MGRLTTHVLDTAHGKPGAGIAIALYRREDANDRAYALVERAVTNHDGRCNAPLLEGPAFAAGQYRLTFATAEYFRRQGVTLPDPPFIDTVLLDFGVADPTLHYHVPLLVSPWSFSTYRGS